MKPYKLTDQRIAWFLDDIDPNWTERFLSTDAAARFYAAEIEGRRKSEESREALLDAGMEP